MEVLEWIAKYWVNWLCMLIAGGIALFAKHYVKLQKAALEEKWKEREEKAKSEVMDRLIKEREDEVAVLREEDDRINKEIDSIFVAIENLNTGILSIQGKQFRDMCEELLKPDHVITIQEYEQFEEDYAAYKGLGGNHRGDALHASVVEKFNKQL